MKKFLSLLLAGTMLFSLAACGEDKEEKSNDENKGEIVEGGGIDIGGAEVGEYITFGSYEQDNDTSNGKEPIEWLVLDKQDGKVLVISKYALANQPFNGSGIWEKSNLRSWLNDTFVSEAFNEAQLKMIPTVTVSAERNETFGTESGNDTQDKVFCLSESEAKKYFALDSERCSSSTKYAEALGATNHSSTGYTNWWLRTTGAELGFATHVGYDGHVSGNGAITGYDLGVRPAMWIEL